MPTQGPLATLPAELLVLIVMQVVALNTQRPRVLKQRSVEYLETQEQWPQPFEESQLLHVLNYNHLKSLSETCQSLRQIIHSLIFEKLVIEPNDNPNQPRPAVLSNVIYKENGFYFETTSSYFTDVPEEIFFNLTYLSITTRFTRPFASPLPGYVHMLNRLPQILDRKFTPNLKYFKLFIHVEKISKKYKYIFKKSIYDAKHSISRPIGTPQIQLHLCTYETIDAMHFDPSFLRYLKFLTVYTGRSCASRFSSFTNVVPNLREVIFVTKSNSTQAGSLMRPANLNLKGQEPNVLPICIIKREFKFIKVLKMKPVLLVCQQFVKKKFSDLSNLTSLYIEGKENYNFDFLTHTYILPSLENFGVDFKTQAVVTNVKKFLTNPNLINQIKRIHVRSKAALDPPLIEQMGPVIEKLSSLVAAHFYDSNEDVTEIFDNLEKLQPHIYNHPSLVALTLPVHISSMPVSFGNMVDFIRTMCRPSRIQHKSSDFKLSNFVLRLGEFHAHLNPPSPNQFFRNGPQSLNFQFLQEHVYVSPYDIFGSVLDLPELSCIEIAKKDTNSRNKSKINPLDMVHILTVNHSVLRTQNSL